MHRMRSGLLLSLPLLCCTLLGALPGALPETLPGAQPETLPETKREPARAACTSVAPTPCPHCFAVLVMPDTQNYTLRTGQPSRGNHLELITRYACDHRSAWTEPSTGKQMPISMVLHLGDLVQSGDLNERKTGAGPLAQWVRVDRAFDNLDRCSPNVPYLVTLGNHDLDGYTYEGKSDGYNTYFGTSRWTDEGHACTAIGACDSAAGQWFLGGGDPIVAGSRNLVGNGMPGPDVNQPGRHRAALIEAPNGQPFLFMGLELASDFPTPTGGGQGDDLAWPNKILDAYPDVATVVFHHSMFWMFEPPDDRLRWGPETWRSDSLLELPRTDPDVGLVGGMRDLYETLLAPRAQVRFIFSGHVFNPGHQADFTIPRASAPPVWGFLRNYQIVDIGDGENYGVGWNVMAVFDPDAGEVRVRSYRIDDAPAYANPPVNLLHEGTPVPTECMATDQGGFPERIIAWDFRVESPVAATSSSLRSSLGKGAVGALFLSGALFFALTTRVRNQHKPRRRT